MNKILKIEEIENLELKTLHNSNAGYKVETEHDVFYILIENRQYCCESWGYFSTEDELQNFVGADLMEIELTDTALATESIEEIEYLDKNRIQFVTFKTSKGVFQLAVYNAHNGYYGHGIYVLKNDACLLDAIL